MIRLHLDESVSPAVAAGLRQRGIDVSTTADAELSGATDAEQIAFALAAERVIVTHDSDFIVHHAAGTPHAGIAYCHQDKYQIGELVRLLVLLHGCFSDEETRGHLEFL
jgi:hypothetical protein